MDDMHVSKTVLQLVCRSVSADHSQRWAAMDPVRPQAVTPNRW